MFLKSTMLIIYIYSHFMGFDLTVALTFYLLQRKGTLLLSMGLKSGNITNEQLKTKFSLPQNGV